MNISPAGDRAQEALETLAQTRAEAAQGDVQAKQKLAQIAKLQPQNLKSIIDSSKAVSEAAAAPSPPPPPTGAVLNVKR